MATIDELFTGTLMLAIPSHAEQQQRKAPGDQDVAGRGDHCTDSHRGGTFRFRASCRWCRLW